MNLVYYFIQQIVNAVSAGSLYAVMAVGLAMVFGILRLINFAYGDQMMVAAYLAVFCLGAGLSLPLALVIMVVGSVLLGLAHGARGLSPVARRAGRGAAALLFCRGADSPEHHAARDAPGRYADPEDLCRARACLAAC